MTKVDILGGSKVAHPNSDWLIGLTSQALLMTAQQQNKKGAKRSQAEILALTEEEHDAMEYWKSMESSYAADFAAGKDSP